MSKLRISCEAEELEKAEGEVDSYSQTMSGSGRGEKVIKLNRRQKKIAKIISDAPSSAREVTDRLVYVFKMTGQTTQNFKKNFSRAMEKHRKDIALENPDPSEYVAKLITSETEEEKEARRKEIRAWLERERQASLRRSRENNFLIVIFILIIFILLLSLF